MSKGLLALVIAVVVAGVAAADITAWHTSPTAVTLGAGEAWYFDIHVTVDPGDSWTAGGLDLAAIHGTFYQDLLDANPPNPAWFDQFPDAEFTSFYTSPGDWPNTAYNGQIVGIASSNDTDQMLDTDWFDTIDAEGPAGGDFMVARVTVLGSSDDAAVYGQFQYASVQNTTLQTLYFVPEPVGLALFALGGLLAFRRR